MSLCLICAADCSDVYSHICEVHIGYKSTKFDIYECPFQLKSHCAFKTPKRHQLTSHIKTHLNLKFYACLYCPKSFKQKHDCKKHMIAKHRDQKLKEPKKLNDTMDLFDPNNFGQFLINS